MRLRVQAADEAARVDEVRRHASETHGIDLSADVALDVVRPVMARAEQRTGIDVGVSPSVASGNSGSTPLVASIPEFTVLNTTTRCRLLARHGAGQW